MKTLRIFSILLFILTIQTNAWAQKIHKVSGEYIYYAPSNVTPEQARQTALERAKNQLIADQFGTVISHTNLTRITTENSDSNIKMTGLNASEVKGEWIETIGEPTYEIGFEGDLLYVKVSISGKIREISSSSIEIKAKLLRNGTEDKFEDAAFRDGDNMYLAIQSPVDGYLTVYLYDGDETVFCLLPYQGQPEGQIPIKAKTPYIFFSSKHDKDTPPHLVDEYMLTCSSEMELNRMYIIFSPNIFTKAVDTLGDTSDMPRLLDYVEFQKWLAKCRTRDPQMILNVKDITISK